ncbi:YqjF family protein [Bacillus cihuensis]|uniref:YqjF family protein n=1 Tax=Bacillus cihuensis TaxID=1208599 RepID=UPI00041BF0AA|nr:DUF2071 domain-containing protein [Bacillus cihuensis]
MHDEFMQLDHRPFPLPSLPWLLSQVWEDLLFIHYPMDPNVLRNYVPLELELDVYQNRAWITIIPFRVTKMKGRGIPSLPLLNAYLEINVRTYVKYKDIPGIYFFSLDANHPLFVIGLKTAIGLPYKHANMEFKQMKNAFQFKSYRLSDKNTSEKINLTYQPGNVLFETLPGTLDHWLLERYCMYSFLGKYLIRGDIHHDQWKVSNATATTSINTMISFLSADNCPNTPSLLHYSKQRRVFCYPPKRVGERLK